MTTTDCAERRLALLGAALGSVVLLVPLLLVAAPPLVDFPQHLVRIWLLAGGAEQQPLDRVYAVDWSRTGTNIGVDLWGRLFGPALGAEGAARTGVGLALLLPVLGTMLLARAATKRWHLLTLLPPALGWTLCVLIGLLNNQIAVGLALLVAAALATWPGKGIVRFVALAAATACIWVVHPAGAFFLATLAGAVGFGTQFPAERAGWARAAGRGLLSAAPALLALVMLASLTELLPAEVKSDISSAYGYRPFFKAIAIVSPLLSYSLAPESALAIALLVLGYVGLRNGWLRAHGGLLLLAGALCVAALVLPSRISDTEQIEFRLAGMAMFVFLAAIAPAGPVPRRTAAAVAAAFLTVAVSRSAWIQSQWRVAEAETRELDRVLLELKPGAALLVVQPDDTPSVRLAGLWPVHDHSALRATMLSRTFVPGLFATDGRRPVRVLEPWSRLALPSIPLRPAEFLRSDAPDVLAAYPYLANWRSDFTHVIVVGGGPERDAWLPVGLEPIVADGFARLHRIR